MSTSCASCGKTDVSLKKCGRCQLIAYCSVDCQRSHWSSHKSACASMANTYASTPSSTIPTVNPNGLPPNLAGFRVQPSANQFSNDPQTADLQRQLLSKIMSDQMAAAGGAEAMGKDPVKFKKMMQQKVTEEMIKAGVNPATLAASLKNSPANSTNAGPQRRRNGTGPVPKNPFTGEEVSESLGKHEMPFGMPGTYYGPEDQEDEDHSGHNHGAGDHGHSHGESGHNHGNHNHSHGSGHNHADHSGHNHSHGGADGEDHSGHNHSHGGGDGEDAHAGHNHSHGGANGHNHGRHNHSHGEGGADGEDHTGHSHGQHNHGHGGEGHNHSHGGDESAIDGAEHNHGHGGAHNHNHGGHNHGPTTNEDGTVSDDHAGHNLGDISKHNHGHGGAGHNHSHGGADGDDHSGHNHSHGGQDGGNHNHSHGGRRGNNHGHNHGGGNDHGHSHGGNGGGEGGPNSGPVEDPSAQRFGNKNQNRGNGKVNTEDSPAAQAAHVYLQPSLQPLTEGVQEGLKELSPLVSVGPIKIDTKAQEAFQLLYASSSSKRPTLPGLPPSSSSLTFLPLSPSTSFPGQADDLAERTGECHLCIIAQQPFGSQPTREDMQLKQSLINNHVRVGRGLEQAFETKEIVASNPPLAGAPAEVSMESLGPDCSIEIHSFQTKMKYINPLDKQYSCQPTIEDLTPSSTATPSPASLTLDPVKLQTLQQTFGLGPSKSTLKKAKAKAKKAAQAAAAAAAASTAPSSGGFLSTITSMFTGSSTPAKPAEPAKEDEDDDDKEDEEDAALLSAKNTAAKDEDDDEKDDGAPSSKEKKAKKKKKAESLPEEIPMTVVQVLVRCAPPCAEGEGFKQALSDKDPLKMYRFEFTSPTPPAAAPSATGAHVAPPLLLAYQQAIDFVITFLHRTHPAPQPTAAQRAVFTVKDAQGNLRPATMPPRMFPSHVALWTDRSEWTGIPKTPFVPKKLPGQEATAEQTEQALVPRHAPKVNHNLYFTPASKTVDYATSKSLALAEQATSTSMLASIWKSYNLKEINLHVFPQGHALYLYKSFHNIEAECRARAAYYAKGKYRPKKLFQNERLDIQLQFEPTAEDIAVMEAERERREKGLPPLEQTARIELEEEAQDEEEITVPVRRFLVL